VAAIPDSARVVLEGPGLAHLVTIGAGGAPQVSCVWVGIEDGEIVFASLGPFQFIYWGDLLDGELFPTEVDEVR